MHYPGDVDADQPHAGYRMPDEDDVLWPDSGYGDPDGGTDGGFALAGGHYGAAGSFATSSMLSGFGLLSSSCSSLWRRKRPC